jgi:hypothetical protein
MDDLPGLKVEKTGKTAISIPALSKLSRWAKIF